MNRHRIKQRVKRAIRGVLRMPPAWLLFVLPLRLRWTLAALHQGVNRNWRERVSVFNFRRNIHRLEKGLSFPDRREVFAEDYVADTVRLLAAAPSNETFDHDTVSWGSAVLDLYFRSVRKTPEIERAFERYRRIKPALDHADWVPYPAARRPELTVRYEDLLELARRRRSVRFFVDRPVEPERVAQAFEVARLSPSSCNRQAFRFLFFDRPELVDALAQVPGGVAGYSVPSIVVVLGRYRGYFDERDLKAPVVDAALAVMSFVLALETLGLSSVCINWPNLGNRERRIRELIDIEPDEVVVMQIGVGYADPDGRVPFSAKRELAELFEVNQRIRRR